MAISEVRFIGLDSGSAQYTAMGGIRFHDGKGNEISLGAVITDDHTSAETDNFILNVDSTYTSNENYHIVNPFDTSKPQTSSDYTEKRYWLTSNDNQTITCEFKITVEALSKIEFNPLPDSSQTNRGIGNDFTIEVYDENSELITSYTVTPITTNDTVQSISTPELEISTYYLLSQNGELYNYNGTFNYIAKRTDLTETIMENNGIKDLSSINISQSDLPYPELELEILKYNSKEEENSIEINGKKEYENEIDVVKNYGIPPSDLSTLTATDWDNLINGSDYLRFGYFLEIDSLDDVAETDLLEMLINMEGTWRKSYSSEYNYRYNFNNSIIIDLMEDGDYKINFEN